MKLIKIRTPKPEDKLSLPKLVVLSGKNTPPTLLTNKNKTVDILPQNVLRTTKSPEKNSVLSNERNMNFYSKSTRNIHRSEIVFNL